MLRSSDHDNNAPVIHAGEVKPILRLESREDFDSIPEQLRDEICKQLGVEWDIHNFNIRVIAEDEKYAGHYMRRVNAVNAGAQFLLDSLMPDKNAEILETLKASLNEITAHCCDYLEKLDSDDISHYQNSLAHYSELLTTMLATTLGIEPKAVKKQLDRAEQFATANHTRPAVCTISHRSGLLDVSDYLVQIDQPLNPFTEELISALGFIKNNDDAQPEWFAPLEKDEKRLLQHFLSMHALHEFGDTINSLSSKLRIIPAPANYGKHTLITLLKDDIQVTVHPSEFRSSHIASRDVSDMPPSIRKTHAYLNLVKEIEDGIAYQVSKLQDEAKKTRIPIPNDLLMPILYQTLITPLKKPDSSLHADRSSALKKINEDLLLMQKKTGINPYLFMITTNHPLNYARWLTPTTSGSKTGQSINNLISMIRNDLNLPSHPEKKLLLDNACNCLEGHLNEPMSPGYSYRELFLSSLEQFIIGEYGGISIGSCVSGKDRKAIEIIHTDALKIYYAIYHKIPLLTASTSTQGEDQRAMDDFAQIFADVYCTQHQMVLADFNAPGSFGVKTPDMYLPGHLIAAIQSWYEVHTTNKIYATAKKKDLLKKSDIMASNNEVKHIKSLSLSADTPDLSWKSSSLAIREDRPIEHYINMAIMATQTYLKTRKERIGFFARLSGNTAGQCRADVYLQLLTDNEINNFQKIILIHALISSNLGENLIDDIVKSMDFNNLDTAVHTLSNYLNTNARYQGMNDSTKPIVDCKTAIQQLLGKLGNSKQMTHCVTNIKAELAKLTPQQSPSLNK